MKRTLIIISMLFITSCSAAWKSEFLTPIPLDGALEVDLYDWETELYGGPSFGHYRPKMYAYKLGDVYYFIYPREITRTGSIGPPIIPLGIKLDEIIPDANLLFKIRYLDPSNKYSDPPIKMSLFTKNDHQVSCNLIQEAKDAVGISYHCSEKIIFPQSSPTRILVEFNNKQKIDVPLKLVAIGGYSPLFSFNGPNPKPKVIIHEKSGAIGYPN